MNIDTIIFEAGRPERFLDQLAEAARADLAREAGQLLAHSRLVGMIAQLDGALAGLEKERSEATPLADRWEKEAAAWQRRFADAGPGVTPEDYSRRAAAEAGLRKARQEHTIAAERLASIAGRLADLGRARDGLRAVARPATPALDALRLAVRAVQ